VDRTANALELIPPYGPEQVSLWRASDGGFLRHTPDTSWEEVPLDGAVTMAYRAPDAHDDRLPPALQAARHVRAAVMALSPQAWANRPMSATSEAVELFHGCKAVTSLMATAQRDIRAHRGGAANTIVLSHGSRADKAQDAAAAQLGVAPSTLSEIISGR
jgi:hypothetical protein